MEPVGFVGIIRLSALIIYRNLKHFLCIALILALPAALNALLLDTSRSIKVLLAYLSLLYKLLFSDLANKDAAPTTIDPSSFAGSPGSKSTPSHVALEMALIAFSLAVSLTCTPLLTYSACRACMGKGVDLRGSARGIGRSVWMLLLTLMCVVAAFLVGGILAALVAILAAAVVDVLGGGISGAVISLAGALAVCAGLIYLAVALILAGTVAILEESRGWEAMRRSMYLVGHKRGVTLALLLLFDSSSLLLLPVLASDSRWIAIGLGVLPGALLGLFRAVAVVVLYMSCRAGLQEPLDSLVAASAHFGPVNSSHAKYLDLETASLTTQST